MKSLASSLVALALLTTPALSQTTLRSASAFGPSHFMATEVYPLVISKLEELTQGRYTAKDFPSGLVAPNEVLNGLKDGVIDMGSLLMMYYPSDFPESSLPNDLALISSNPIALSAAATEYIVTCKECQEEYRNAGVVYFGTGGTVPYQVLSKEPVLTPSDFEGLKMRVAGTIYNQWAVSMKSQPVQIATSETYEALNQGTIQASFASLAEIANGQLYDVLGHVTMTNFGSVVTDCAACVSANVWKDMSKEDRAAMLKAAQYGYVQAVKGWESSSNAAREKSIEAGIKFHEPSPEVIAMIESFKEQYIAKPPEHLSQRGIKNPGDKIARFRGLVEKWEKLMDGHAKDNDSLVETRLKEIFATVDLGEYGL